MKVFFLFILQFAFLLSYCQISVDSFFIEVQNNPTNAIKVADSLLLTAMTKKDFAEVKYQQGVAYLNNNNPKKAIQLFLDALPILEGDVDKKIRILLNLSDGNVRLRNYSEAMNYAITALELAKDNDLPKLVASANTALSFVSYSAGDYLTAISFLLHNVDLQGTLKDSIPLSATYNNLAILYKKIGDFEQALSINEKSLEISIAMEDHIGIGKSYSNIGRIYELIGNNKKALDLYQQAIENNRKFSIKNSIPFRNIGDLYRKLGAFDETEKFLEEALNIETKNSDLALIYKSLLKNAILQNDFKKALVYQTKADSISNINRHHSNEEKIKMLEYQYKHFKDREIFRREKSKNRIYKLLFASALILLLLIGLIWFFKVKNKQLRLEKDKMFLEQSVLRSQMNPHFIFNALSAIQNSILDNDPVKSAGYLSKFAELIRQNFDFVNERTILLVDEMNALKNYMDTQKMRFEDKFDYEIIIDEDIDVNQVEIPPLLLQPFIENSIEHGFRNKKEKGQIKISVGEGKSFICYEISDNGNGYSGKNDDSRLHALDIFKKRLKLFGNQDEKTFRIKSDYKGTTVKFCLKK